MNKLWAGVILCLVFTLAYGIVSAAEEQPEILMPIFEQADEPAEETVAEPPPLPTELPPTEYQLQPEDIMRITVWGEPNLTTEQMIDPNGYIQVGFLGQVQAAGLTQQELINKISSGLSKYVREPKVQLMMAQFRKPKIHVLGQVNRPGLHEIKIGDRVMEAIAQAGSFGETAYLENATLTHKGSDMSIPLDLKKLFHDGDMTYNLPLTDGDTIFIPEDTMNRYFVLGEVLRPGMYRLKENVTVMDAISMSGGPNQRGSLKGAAIIRGESLKDLDGESEPERIEVNISKLLKEADMSQNIALMPGDVLYIPESSRPDWNRIGGIVSAIVNTTYLFRVLGF